MIEVYKILHGVYDEKVVPELVTVQGSVTRGNSLKLKVNRCKYDINKFSFCSRAVLKWNMLPDSMVLASSVNAFKNNLDKFWDHDGIIYDQAYDFY